jgi:hypothetical protein
VTDTLIVTVVGSGYELDRIVLVDGHLTFATGNARTLFSDLYNRRPALSEAEMFRLRTDWSNGYIQIKPLVD